MISLLKKCEFFLQLFSYAAEYLSPYFEASKGIATTKPNDKTITAPSAFAGLHNFALKSEIPFYSQIMHIYQWGGFCQVKNNFLIRLSGV
jgi:hypothetical protein